MSMVWLSILLSGFISDGFDLPGERARIDWLNNVGVTTRAKSLLAGKFLGIGGNGNDGDLASRGVVLQLASQREAVHAGQSQIQKDNVWVRLVNGVDGLFSRLGIDDLMTARGQDERGEFTAGWLVFN